NQPTTVFLSTRGRTSSIFRTGTSGFPTVLGLQRGLELVVESGDKCQWPKNPRFLNIPWRLETSTIRSSPCRLATPLPLPSVTPSRATLKTSSVVSVAGATFKSTSKRSAYGGLRTGGHLIRSIRSSPSSNAARQPVLLRSSSYSLPISQAPCQSST